MKYFITFCFLALCIFTYIEADSSSVPDSSVSSGPTDVSGSGSSESVPAPSDRIAKKRGGPKKKPAKKNKKKAPKGGKKGGKKDAPKGGKKGGKKGGNKGGKKGGKKGGQKGGKSGDKKGDDKPDVVNPISLVPTINANDAASTLFGGGGSEKATDEEETETDEE